MKKHLGRYFIILVLQLSMWAGGLVDAKDSYPTTAVDWDVLNSYLIGFLSMLAGFLFAKFEIFKKLKDKLSKR